MAINKQVILEALRDAIEWKVSLINAHNHCTDAENKKWIADWKKQIDKYRREILKLRKPSLPTPMLLPYDAPKQVDVDNTDA